VLHFFKCRSDLIVWIVVIYITIIVHFFNEINAFPENQCTRDTFKIYILKSSYSASDYLIEWDVFRTWVLNNTLAGGWTTCQGVGVGLLIHWEWARVYNFFITLFFQIRHLR